MPPCTIRIWSHLLPLRWPHSVASDAHMTCATAIPNSESIKIDRFRRADNRCTAVRQPPSSRTKRVWFVEFVFVFRVEMRETFRENKKAIKMRENKNQSQMKSRVTFNSRVEMKRGTARHRIKGENFYVQFNTGKVNTLFEDVFRLVSVTKLHSHCRSTLPFVGAAIVSMWC